MKILKKPSAITLQIRPNFPPSAALAKTQQISLSASAVPLPQQTTASTLNNSTHNSGEGSGAPALDLEDEIIATLPQIAPPPKEGSMGAPVSERHSSDGRVERVYQDQRREILFTNGLRKILWPDGRCTVLFSNGDVKDCLADSTVVYRYATTSAVQTTFGNGVEVFQFVSGQVERHFPNGEKEIKFQNKTTKKIYSSGVEEIRFPDGSVKRVNNIARAPSP